MCPVYMCYGMTYEQFWFGDPRLTETYREYFLLKKRMDNETLWIQGAYFYNALNAVISTAFGNKREKYLSKPMDIFPKTKAEKEEEKRTKRIKLINYLNSLKIPKKDGKKEQ